jgi:hypothetical protein
MNTKSKGEKSVPRRAKAEHRPKSMTIEDIIAAAQGKAGAGLSLRDILRLEVRMPDELKIAGVSIDKKRGIIYIADHEE